MLEERSSLTPGARAVRLDSLCRLVRPLVDAIVWGLVLLWLVDLTVPRVHVVAAALMAVVSGRLCARYRPTTPGHWTITVAAAWMAAVAGVSMSAVFVSLPLDFRSVFLAFTAYLFGDVVARLAAGWLGNGRGGALSGSPARETGLVGDGPLRQSAVARALVLKRYVDLLFTLFLLPLLLAPILVVALARVVTRTRPIFHVQSRVTQRGRVFRIYKLRTMAVGAETAAGPVWPLDVDPRVTRAGRRLRNLWVDELPQFCNVLFGDMSWVGPRPERPEFVQVFSKVLSKYPIRHTFPAGLTGLAQILGFTGNTSIRRRLRCDLAYVRLWSPGLDCRILCATAVAVLRRKPRRKFVIDPRTGTDLP